MIHKTFNVTLLLTIFFHIIRARVRRNQRRIYLNHETINMEYTEYIY